MFTYLHFQPPCSIYYHTLLVRAGPFYMYKIAKKHFDFDKILQAYHDREQKYR